MRKPQPRDNRGRFKRRYVRPPRLGTMDRMLWDAAALMAAMYADEYEKREANWRWFLKHGGLSTSPKSSPTGDE